MSPTPNEIVLRLADLSRMLDAATTDLEKLDDESVRAEQSYVVAFARATITAEGPADIRKATATEATADERLAAEIAAAKVRACKERIRTLHAQLDVGRSLGAALRAEASFAHSGAMP